MFRSSLFYFTDQPNLILNHLRYNLFEIEYLKNIIEVFESDINKVYHNKNKKEVVLLKKNYSKTKNINLIEFDKFFYKEDELKMEDFVDDVKLKKIKTTEKVGVYLFNEIVNVEIIRIDEDKNKWIVNFYSEGENQSETEVALNEANKSYFSDFAKFDKIDEFFYM